MEDCRMKNLITILLFIPLVACSATPSKSELDAEVKRLCAIDGGIKVYETVKLPPEKFGKTGLINFYRPTQEENALGSEYLFKSDRHWYTPASPNEFDAKMSRVHIVIIRRSDSKTLAEMTVYERGGGDIPGPWYPSGFSCPEIKGGEHALLKKTFLNQIEGQ